MSKSRREVERYWKNLAALKAAGKGHQMTNWKRDSSDGRRLVSRCIRCGGTANLNVDRRMNGTALTATCKERMKSASRDAESGVNRKVSQKKSSSRQQS